MSDSFEKNESDNTVDLGIRITGLTPEIAGRFGYNRDEKGVLVLEVDPGRKGDRSGIKTGDLIVEINHIPVTNQRDFQNEFSKVKPGDSVQLLVKRTHVGFVVVKFDK